MHLLLVVLVGSEADGLRLVAFFVGSNLSVAYGYVVGGDDKRVVRNLFNVSVQSVDDSAQEVDEVT